MAHNLVAFTEQMDRCWIERRFEDLSAYIADDVVLVAPGDQLRMEGLEASVESYREFMRRCKISRFNTRDHIVTERGASAVVEYEWDMAWTDEELAHEAKGREILVLSKSDIGWRVVWRTQLTA